LQRVHHQSDVSSPSLTSMVIRKVANAATSVLLNPAYSFTNSKTSTHMHSVFVQSANWGSEKKILRLQQQFCQIPSCRSTNSVKTLKEINAKILSISWVKLMSTCTCLRGRARIGSSDRSLKDGYRSDVRQHPSHRDCRNAPSAALVLHWRRLQIGEPVTFIKLFSRLSRCYSFLIVTKMAQICGL